MANTYAAVGFPHRMTHEEIEQLYYASQAGEVLHTGGGSYLCWTPGEGIEVWISFVAAAKEDDDADRERAPEHRTGFTVHYGGTTHWPILLADRHRLAEHNALQGCFVGLSRPQATEADPGYEPIMFEVPDAARFASVPLQTIVNVQLSAFALQMETYDSLAEFDASEAAELGFSTEFFAAAGIMVAQKEDAEPEAIFTGTIVHSRDVRNPYTGRRFLATRVRTRGGELDVVACPDNVRGAPAEGQIAYVIARLSGRLPEELATGTIGTAP